jgi:hypothetical protein
MWQGRGKHEAHFCNTSYLEAEVGESSSEAGLGKKYKTLSKNKVKQKGLRTQVVEHLPYKCKALSSNCQFDQKKF